MSSGAMQSKVGNAQVYEANEQRTGPGSAAYEREHPARFEAGQANAYHSGMNGMLGRPIDRLLHRLDALVLVLKTCTGNECRWPWRQLHPDNVVQNLTAALDVRYDEFYANSYKQARVGWLECYTGFGTGGADSALYSVCRCTKLISFH